MAHNDAADGMTSEQPTYEYRVGAVNRRGGEEFWYEEFWYDMLEEAVVGATRARKEMRRLKHARVWIERRIVGPWEKVEL